ncbi:hypothetical protein T4D_5194 [Trichinella pseudospiralis]|uniref:Uncharacterized protein n=1 Tax=Trichinella pseudospiralis TaxID=6337 RepID=A0A0V1DLD6_TRIPS|nr:hypothetical protein T4D_5194 [Trichinella pseudospiralis]
MWGETLNNVKNEKCTLNWNMARKLTNEENEKLTW